MTALLVQMVFGLRLVLSPPPACPDKWHPCPVWTGQRFDCMRRPRVEGGKPRRCGEYSERKGVK